MSHPAHDVVCDEPEAARARLVALAATLRAGRAVDPCLPGWHVAWISPAGINTLARQSCSGEYKVGASRAAWG